MGDYFLFNLDEKFKRSDYWWGGIAAIIIFKIAYYVLGLFFGVNGIIAATIFLIWSNIVIHIKRLNDLGVSRWIVLLLFTGIGNLALFIYCGFFPSKVEKNYTQNNRTNEMHRRFEENRRR